MGYNQKKCILNIYALHRKTANSENSWRMKISQSFIKTFSAVISYLSILTHPQYVKMTCLGLLSIYMSLQQ